MVQAFNFTKELESLKNYDLNDARVSILLLDTSGSMEDFDDAPIKAIQAHINRLATDRNHTHYSCVVGYSDRLQVILPMQKIDRETEVLPYKNEGTTKCYEFTEKILSAVTVFAIRLKKADKNVNKIIFATLSDGEDNQSKKGLYPEKCQLISRQALSESIELLTMGVGRNGEELAQALGFPTETAITVEHSSRGLEQTIKSYSDHTVC